MNRGAAVQHVSGLTEGHAAAFTGGAVQNRTGGTGRMGGRFGAPPHPSALLGKVADESLGCKRLLDKS